LPLPRLLLFSAAILLTVVVVAAIILLPHVSIPTRPTIAGSLEHADSLTWEVSLHVPSTASGTVQIGDSVSVLLGETEGHPEGSLGAEIVSIATRPSMGPGSEREILIRAILRLGSEVDVSGRLRAGSPVGVRMQREEEAMGGRIIAWIRERGSK
jgi:hypothetical protein